MNDVVSLFSSNPLVLAIANIAALCTAGWAIYRTTLFVARFVVVVYKNNVQTAIYKIRRNTYVSSLVYAQDIHMYISFLVIRCGFIGGLVLNLLIIGENPVRTRQEFIDNPPRMNFSSYEEYLKFEKAYDLFTALAQVSLVIVLGYLGYRLIRIASNVWRIRMRWYKRGHLQPLHLKLSVPPRRGVRS